MTTVLIVDDDPDSRSIIRDLLLPDGYDLVEAGSGLEAIEAVSARTPEVIIASQMMSGMDGIELCRRLRAGGAMRGTPIIMVTALDSPDEMARALDEGVTDFITRPLIGIEVRARVRSMIRVARARTALEQLLALRTDFTNMVIHDLRNPLQVISFSTEILQRSSSDPSPPLLRIRAQVVRLQKLIDDLLVVAKSDAGVLVAHRSAIDANALVQLVVEDCLPAAARVEIGITANIDVEWPLYVDPALMRRCLENLVLNAIKFSPSKTKVTIDVHQGQQSVRIDVIDEGSGVPDELRHSMFQPFATGEPKTPLVKQTGLGLAFCRMVAEAHGGTLAALPREGRGSILRLSLPAVSSCSTDLQ
ncbi:MAG: two-component system, sensor histidine kinase and response regulator [Thermoanaerobaculia bacterium]|nr:two-component system, sensor histidine kinase and response regulator [Thermoanaerobaculia bacterium]